MNIHLSVSVSEYYCRVIVLIVKEFKVPIVQQEETESEDLQDEVETPLHLLQLPDTH